MASRKEPSRRRWSAPPEALTRRFNDIVARYPDVSVRSMFGCPSAFVGGQMFAGVFEQSVFVRLSPEERATILERLAGKPFEPLPGRVMKEYVILPMEILGDEAKLLRWIGEAHAYASGLPTRPQRRKTKASRH